MSEPAEDESAAPRAESAEQSADGDRAKSAEQSALRPPFLQNFPDDPALSRLVRAFEVGNYAVVREEAGPLAERTEDPRVRAAALELRRRIDPDPLTKYLLALAVALLLFLLYFAYHH